MIPWIQVLQKYSSSNFFLINKWKAGSYIFRKRGSKFYFMIYKILSILVLWTYSFMKTRHYIHFCYKKPISGPLIKLRGSILRTSPPIIQFDFKHSLEVIFESHRLELVDTTENWFHKVLFSIINHETLHNKSALFRSMSQQAIWYVWP